MKNVPACLNDPILHAAIVGAMLVGTYLIAGRESHAGPVASHPATCHACSLSPARFARDRDAVLARMGVIDLADIAD